MTTPSLRSTPPKSFSAKKASIVSKLMVPDAEYDDLSPKGSVDVGIRDLIDDINARPGCVTTSSCAGRVSVFLEGGRAGQRDDRGQEGRGHNIDGEVLRSSYDDLAADEDGDLTTWKENGKYKETTAGTGGKGGGGRWLYVSHDPIDLTSLEQNTHGALAELLGLKPYDQHSKIDLEKLMDRESRDLRYIHFKFEPMILHILTASVDEAQIVLSSALQAGFRESGAQGLVSTSASAPATPMVAVRSMGLAIESLVGVLVDDLEVCMQAEWQLKTLIKIANERFLENEKRIQRFQGLLKDAWHRERTAQKEGDQGAWEDKDARRERMKAEGIMRSQATRTRVPSQPTLVEVVDEWEVTGDITNMRILDPDADLEL